MQKFILKKPDKEVTTIRIPKDVLDIIDQKSTACGISRNEFINQCIMYALENMEDRQ
ncbi:MAG: CopG family transcriptional regulator [Clostridia bacterium]|nr:MAG: CopG family transcriptional regulator [Clostridia bacterium]